MERFSFDGEVTGPNMGLGVVGLVVATGDEVGATGRSEDPVLPFFTVLLSLAPFPV